MAPLKRSVAFSYVLSIWTLGYAKSCGKQQTLINGLCCDECPPGYYFQEFCTEHKQTVCSPCPAGYYSDDFNLFDRCEACQPCQQEYAEKCTSTTNAKCSCGSGFLCSNNKCLTCEKNKCVVGETVKRTDNPAVGGLIKYSYMCIACPAHDYLDVKEETCKPRTQCSTLGLAELFPGNKTHNSVCKLHELTVSRSGDSTHTLLGISFLLLSFCFLAILSTVFVKNQRKHKPNNNPESVCTNTADFPLPKEECGLQLSIPDDEKDCSCSDKLHQGEVTTLVFKDDVTTLVCSN